MSNLHFILVYQNRKQIQVNHLESIRLKLSQWNKEVKPHYQRKNNITNLKQ